MSQRPVEDDAPPALHQQQLVEALQHRTEIDSGSNLRYPTLCSHLRQTHASQQNTALRKLPAWWTLDEHTLQCQGLNSSRTGLNRARDA